MHNETWEGLVAVEDDELHVWVGDTHGVRLRVVRDQKIQKKIKFFKICKIKSHSTAGLRVTSSSLLKNSINSLSVPV